MANLEQLFQWYLDHQEELVKEYDGKYLVILENKEVIQYDDENTAYFDAVEKYGLGNFIIQLCTPGEDAYTVHMYTPRYAFS